MCLRFVCVRVCVCVCVCARTCVCAYKRACMLMVWVVRVSVLVTLFCVDDIIIRYNSQCVRVFGLDDML